MKLATEFNESSQLEFGCALAPTKWSLAKLRTEVGQSQDFSLVLSEPLTWLYLCCFVSKIPHRPGSPGPATVRNPRSELGRLHHRIRPPQFAHQKIYCACSAE
jgi:hypothetical protein